MKFGSPFALLLLAGLAAYHVVPAQSDNRCIRDSDEETVTLTLDPPSSYCGQSSVDVTVTKHRCQNNGNECECKHHTHHRIVESKFCIADAYTIEEDTTTVYGSNGCSATVTYTYIDIASCKCRFIENLFNVGPIGT